MLLYIIYMYSIFFPSFFLLFFLFRCTTYFPNKSKFVQTIHPFRCHIRLVVLRIRIIADVTVATIVATAHRYMLNLLLLVKSSTVVCAIVPLPQNFCKRGPSIVEGFALLVDRCSRSFAQSQMESQSHIVSCHSPLF